MRYIMLIVLSIFGLSGFSEIIGGHGILSIEAIEMINDECEYVENDDFEYVYDHEDKVGIIYYDLYGNNEFDIDYRNEISNETVQHQVRRFNAATTNLDVSFIVVGSIIVFVISLIVMKYVEIIKKKE